MEINNEIIEWKMIRPDGSQRVLHIGKNEVNSRELDFLSNNSLILFEIYFSPHLKAFLRFYGYTPLRLNFEKDGEDSKHIYIDNNQSFVFLEQLEKTTIDVYDKEEFVTFSFQKSIKKPENSKDIIEKNKRMKWLNDNIEYEDLKKEENEYGNKSLYSRDYFNYSKKNLKKVEEQNDKSDLMSNFSKNKSDDNNMPIEEKIEENNNKEKNKEKEKKFNQVNHEESIDEENIEPCKEKKENLNTNNILNKNESNSKNKSMEIDDSKIRKKNLSKKSSSNSGNIEKESQKIISKNNIKLDKKSKSTNSEQSPLSNTQKVSLEEEEGEEKDSENKAKKKLLNYDKILDNFVLLNSDSESKEDSSDNEEEENLEKSENSPIKNMPNLQLKKENSLSKKDKITKCTICLDQMTNPATLKPCGHQFCKDCISKWLKNSSACPDCKKNAKKLYFFSSKNRRYMGKKIKRKKYKAEKQNFEDWFLNCDKTCLICGKEDNTAYLLICDSCNFRICHTFCVGLDSIPDTEWHCPECEAKEKGKNFSLSKTNLKKYKEKENKLLKVKQSEVKENNSGKKENKSKEESKDKIIKRKNSNIKDKENKKKPEITVMSLRNRSNNNNLKNMKTVNTKKENKPRRKLSIIDYNNNKKGKNKKQIKKSKPRIKKRKLEKKEDEEEEEEEEEDEEEEYQQEEEEEDEEIEEEEEEEEEEEGEEDEEEEEEEEEEEKEKEKEKKSKKKNKSRKIKNKRIQENKTIKLLQRKTNRKKPKEKENLKKINRKTNKTKKRKYSLDDKNLNIINLRSRDKNKQSIGQRILSRRKSSHDSAELIIQKKRKKTKEISRKK